MPNTQRYRFALQICDIRLATCDIGFACHMFSSKTWKKNGIPPNCGIPFIFNCHKVTPQHADRHISHCVSNISNFHRKYFAFPSGKISLGCCRNPFLQHPFTGVLLSVRCYPAIERTGFVKFQVSFAALKADVQNSIFYLKNACKNSAMGPS